MPSVFENLFSEVGSPLLEAYSGEPVGYVSRAGQSYDDCVGIWNADDFLNPSPDEYGKVEKASGEIWIRKVWYATHEFTPSRGDDVTIGGKIYAAIHIREDGDWWIIALSSVERVETGDGATRGRQR